MCNIKLKEVMFSRKCDKCGIGMNEGYLDDGKYYWEVKNNLIQGSN